jgi:hypothetical protein
VAGGPVAAGAIVAADIVTVTGGVGVSAAASVTLGEAVRGSVVGAVQCPSADARSLTPASTTRASDLQPRWPPNDRNRGDA